MIIAVQDAVINWAELTNEQVYNKFRALSQTVGVYTTFNQLRVTLCNIQLATADLVEQLHEDKHSLLLQPGMIGYRGVLKTREVFLVACKVSFPYAFVFLNCLVDVEGIYLVFVSKARVEKADVCHFFHSWICQAANRDI